MARIHWHDRTYAAALKERLPDGGALMVMQEHGPRFTAGTVVRVTAAQIESLDEVAPVEPAASAAALETAMAEERKTIPSVREVLMKAAKDKAAAEAPPS